MPRPHRLTSIGRPVGALFAKRKSLSNRRFRPELASLEARVVLSIVNGNFAVSDPSSPGFGYTELGNATVSGGQGILNEGSTIQTEIAQTFTIDPGTTQLVFTIAANQLTANGAGKAPDAFEVALLDATTKSPLVGPPAGLSNTDSFLNIQQTGQVFYAPGVTVPGASASGQVASLSYPLLITVDVSVLPAGTRAAILFDLVGLSPASSSVQIANLAEVNGNGPPPLSVRLDPASETGPAATSLTRLGTVAIDGTTNPGQSVTLTSSGEGSLTATADGAGQFTFPAVPLSEGPNTIRVGATGPNGASSRSLVVTLDDQPPTGSLAVPGPGSAIAVDPGFVEEQYADPGAAGLDPASFSTANLRITGVTVTKATDLGNGLVRYDYAGTLPTGSVVVSRVAGSVRDLAGNGDAAGSDTFLSLGPNTNLPVAVDDTYATTEGTPLAVAAPGVLGNDSGTNRTALLGTPPSHGTLQFNADGSFLYVPTPGFFGSDAFSYETSSGPLVSRAATVTIVTAPPRVVAINDSYATAANTLLDVPRTSGILSNDAGSGLTAVLVTPPGHGRLSLNPDGSFAYLPTDGFSGVDSFVYDALSGSFRSNDALVTLTVSPATSLPVPIARADAYTTPAGQTLNVPAPGVLSNDLGTRLRAVLVSPTTHGTLTLNPDGSFIYVPAPGSCGDDHFSYRDVGPSSASDPTTVILHITHHPASTADLSNLARQLLADYVRDPATYAKHHPRIAILFAALRSGDAPSTPFYRYLETRRARNPARFDHYHPNVGPLIQAAFSACTSVGTTQVRATRGV